MEKLKKISINRYTGYHHNRYDGYSSSRGILAACGGTLTADCFCDESDNEIDNAIFNGITPINWEEVLQNLEITEDELQEIESGEKITINEYWGNEKIPIIFSGNPDRIVNVYYGEFIANY